MTRDDYACRIAVTLNPANADHHPIIVCLRVLESSNPDPRCAASTLRMALSEYVPRTRLHSGRLESLSDLPDVSGKLLPRRIDIRLHDQFESDQAIIEWLDGLPRHGRYRYGISTHCIRALHCYFLTHHHQICAAPDEVSAGAKNAPQPKRRRKFKTTF